MMICDRSRRKLRPRRNDMEELKYLICAIDSCKCPRVSSPPSWSIILPPRVEEIPCEIQRRPPCAPPPRCCPITPGPCCPPPPLTPPIILTQPCPQPCPQPLNLPCRLRSPLPCYPTYCR